MNKVTSQNSNKYTIILRADGGPNIGMGHFVRTLALGEMLQDNFYCIYATKSPTEQQKKEIYQVCDELIELPDDNSHFNTFFKHLRGDEIVVLDNYYFDTEYQKKIKSIGSKLVCIDDIHDKHYVADVVINHAPLSMENFSTESFTRLLVGFDYALLRSAFFNKTVKSDNANNFNHALICFGGADFKNLTSQTLEDLSRIEQIREVSIVVGNAYQYKELLKTEISRHSGIKNIKLYQNLSAQDFREVINRVDFGVLPCSTVLLEAISQNLPIITGYYVDNQKEIANRLKGNYSKLLVLGDLNTENVKKQHIEQLEKSTQEKAYYPLISSKVIDTILKEFKSLCQEFLLNARKADKSDLDIYFEWANDKDVRKNAINSNPIEYKNHVKWFNKKISDGSSFMYLFEKDNIPVGQVRFDKEGDSFLIDYSVDKKYRGQGLGQIIVKNGIEKLSYEIKDLGKSKLKAIVKDENIASAKVFRKMNFQQSEVKLINEHKYIVLQKRLI